MLIKTNQYQAIFKSIKHKCYSSSSKVDSIRTAILNRSLEHAKELGFNKQSLLKSTNELNYPSVTLGILQNGELDLIEHFLIKARKETLDQLQGEEFQSLSKEDKIKEACLLRLKYNLPYMKSLPEAFSILATYKGSFVAIEQLKQLVNDIHYKCGDASYDMRWYKKRMALALIYSSTELYMFQDSSPNFKLTEEFLKRRLSELKDIKELSDDVGQIASFGYKSVLGLLEAKGIRF